MLCRQTNETIWTHGSLRGRIWESTGVNFNQAALRAKNFTSMHCTPSFRLVQQIKGPLIFHGSPASWGKIEAILVWSWSFSILTFTSEAWLCVLQSRSEVALTVSSGRYSRRSLDIREFSSVVYPALWPVRIEEGKDTWQEQTNDWRG